MRTGDDDYWRPIEDAKAAATRAERERCAQIAETHQCQECECCGAERDIAAKIRAGLGPGNELAPCVIQGRWWPEGQPKPGGLA